MSPRTRLWACLGGLVALSCGTVLPKEVDGDKTIPFDPNRPTMPAATTAPLYSGSDPLVLEAQTRYRTRLDLHRKLIMRSCSGTNGVCHNQKEYPDMHTAATFASTIGAACNVQPGSYTGVFDRCERAGDRFRFDDPVFPDIEVGYIYFIPGEAGDAAPTKDTPGLHLHLSDPVPLERRERYTTGLFLRGFLDPGGSIQKLPFANYTTRWIIFGDGRELFAEVNDNDVDEVNTLLKAGIIQGDLNRNGVFGARSGKLVSLLNPAKPEESYLVARLRGHMQGDYVPGTRMPLANQPPSTPDMVALMCFIEGLDPGATQWNLESSINFEGCSYSADAGGLNLVGVGVSWSGRIGPLLSAHCGGCHGGATPQMGLDLTAPDAHAQLLKASQQKASLKLIEPGRPEASYLWLKVAGDGSIVGQRMPLDPQTNTPAQPLSDADLQDLQTWILAGALP
jgi:hypothetical protein